MGRAAASPLACSSGVEHGLISGSQPCTVDYQSQIAKVEGHFRSAAPQVSQSKLKKPQRLHSRSRRHSSRYASMTRTQSRNDCRLGTSASLHTANALPPRRLSTFRPELMKEGRLVRHRGTQEEPPQPRSDLAFAQQQAHEYHRHDRLRSI